MKNVLWLASWYPNRLDNFDGDFIQRHARAVAEFCNVHVIYVMKDVDKADGDSSNIQHSGNLTEQIIYYKPTVTSIKIIDRLLSFKKYNQTFRKAINYYVDKNGKPDFVHVHVAMKAGLAAIWMKKKWNLPFIVTEHWTAYYRNSIPSLYDHSSWYKRMNNEVLKQSKKLLPVSESLAEEIVNNFVKVPYQVIPNVVDTSLFYFKPSAPQKFRFIHVSYMNFQKNPEGIFEAIAILRKRGYDFEILMLGNENESLTALAAKYSLLPGIVFFQNAVPYAQVALAMQQASAFLLFSRFENLPCVLLEALCCGLPVISTKVGGIKEVVNEQNGILVENGNIESLANAMQQVMDTYHDYNRQEIATKASAKFNYEKVGRQIADLYK